MRTQSALLTVPAFLGLALAPAADARAACRHGYAACSACGVAGPGYAYGYAPFATPYAERPSFLAGYRDDGPIVPVAAGTPLVDGQLFGSHVFGVLDRFGRGLDRSGLVALAERAFVDAAGVAPTIAEREALGRIVARFVGEAPNFAPPPRPTEPAAGALPSPFAPAGAGLRVIVTVEIPPGARAGEVRAEARPFEAEAAPPPPATPDPPPAASELTPPLPFPSVEPLPSTEPAPRPAKPAGYK